MVTVSSRIQPTGSSRREVAASLRAHAKRFETDLPAVGASGHLRDAAASLEHGNTESARRHLRAAMNTLTPQSLLLHGVHDDEGHTAARQHLTEIHRRLLRVSEIQDTEQDNEQRRAAAQPGNPAMNAPLRTSAGPSDGAAAGPASPAPAGSRQFSNTVDLVGPKGYKHNWQYVGVPGDSISPTPLQASGRTWKMQGQPGDMQHIRSIAEAGDRVAGWSPTTANALYNVARSVARRDMHSASLHMQSARWGNQAEMNGAWTKEIAQIEQSLAQVPKGVQPLPPLRQPPVQDLRRMLAAGGLPMDLYNPRLSGQQPALELSERTAMLERTPAPRGKPGGPGLYHVKGLEHSPYFQQVVKALIDKRGMKPDQAYRVAWGALRKWRAGGGHVHPEVQAAAGRGLAKEDEARAQAHSGGWDAVELAILDLGGPGSGNPGQARIAAGGAGGGQFTKGGGGPPAGNKAKAQKKARLLAFARACRAKAARITAQIQALQRQLQAMQAPRKHTGKAVHRRPAKPGAAKKATSTPRKKGGVTHRATAATVSSQIISLRGQRAQLLAQAAAAIRQAAHL